MALIIGLGSAYFIYDKYKLAKNEELSQKYALITAKTWVATAKFKDKPDEYMAYRDSILTSHNVGSDEIELFLAEHNEEAEYYFKFAGFVKIYVDSLVAIEDSIQKALPDSLGDTLNLEN